MMWGAPPSVYDLIAQAKALDVNAAAAEEAEAQAE